MDWDTSKDAVIAPRVYSLPVHSNPQKPQGASQPQTASPLRSLQMGGNQAQSPGIQYQPPYNPPQPKQTPPQHFPSQTSPYQASFQQPPPQFTPPTQYTTPYSQHPQQPQSSNQRFISPQKPQSSPAHLREDEPPPGVRLPGNCISLVSFFTQT